MSEADLDEFFTYHAWGDYQVRLGGDIRRAAKELCRAILRSKNMENLASKDCRDRALTMVRLAVQEANAAITFEGITHFQPRTQPYECAEAKLNHERDRQGT